MNVQQMINLIGTLGIGETQAESDQKRIALQYLNLAHDQLYRETASLNADILKNEVLSNAANQGTFTLSDMPFAIYKIFPIGQVVPLQGMSILDFAQYQFENAYFGPPNVYCFNKKVVSFYPLQTNVVYQFNTWYAPKRTPFNEYTTEEQVPYPVEYHPVLVDGALYYLFQDESGFKNPLKENEALKRWKMGKADLIAYFYGSNKQRISTFSNA